MHWLQRRDWWGNSCALWVLATLSFIAPLAWWSLWQIRLNNDVERWLPENDPERQILEWVHELFPTQDRILLTWRDSGLQDPRLNTLVKNLRPHWDAEGVRRGGSPYVQEVISPHELLQQMQAQGVEPREAVRRLLGLFIGTGPLRIKLSEVGKSLKQHLPAEWAQAAQRDLGLTLEITPASPDLLEKTSIPIFEQDLTTEEQIGSTSSSLPSLILSPSGEILETHNIEHDFCISWPGIRPGSEQTQRVVTWLSHYIPPWESHRMDAPKPALVAECFFVAGAPVGIAIALSEAGRADPREALKDIRQRAMQAGIASDSLHWAGSTIASTELNRAVAHAAWNVHAPWWLLPKRSILFTSALAIALLALILVRHVALAGLVLCVTLYTTFLAMAIVPASGGVLTMIHMVMPSLMMVITLSASIHMVNYWRLSHSAPPAEAAVMASKHAFWPCLMAAVSTALGVGALCSSSLAPVREFGFYAAAGTLVSLAIVLWGIPSLLMLWKKDVPPPHEGIQQSWRWWGEWLVRHASWGLAVSLTLTALCSFGLVFFRTETRAIRYFSRQASIVQDYHFLENHLSGAATIELLIRFDADAQHEENYLDRQEVIRAVEERLREHPEVTGCLALADFRPISQPPDDSASMLARSRYHKQANIIEDKLRSGEIAGVGAFYKYLEAQQQLPQITPNLFGTPGDEIWRITAQVRVMSSSDYHQVLQEIDSRVREILRYHPGADHIVTGTVPVFLRTQQAVLESLISSSGLAFALIAAIFVIQFRSLMAGLLSMVPNVIPITVIFGLVSLGGITIDVGTMMTASISLGMAVDSTLHFLTWFQRELRTGKGREQAVVSAVVHCGPAISQTACAVALGLLVLVPSELSLISRFGWIMAAMLGVALLGDIVILPQILASPLGCFFESSRRQSKSLPRVKLATEHDVTHREAAA
ncbi:MAG: hypothetical protein KatS3mg113_0362 [Planctomycetaceae bacterium]|nr:MAG: hypothetical protein KatS3mg113_0362 [Planctomycetaceae bacterium]